MSVFDKPLYEEGMLSMSMYDKQVYIEDILCELPGLMSKFPPHSVKFDDAAEYEDDVVNDDEELSSTIPSLFSRFEYVTKLALKCDYKSVSIGDEALIQCTQRCRNFMRLKLCDYRELADEEMSFLAPSCRNVHKFSCGSYNFRGKGMNALIKNCRLLEELSVKLLQGITNAAVADAFGPVKAVDSLKIISLKEIYNRHCFGP